MTEWIFVRIDSLAYVDRRRTVWYPVVMPQIKRRKKISEEPRQKPELNASYVFAHIVHWYLLFAVIVAGIFAAYVLTRGIA